MLAVSNGYEKDERLRKERADVLSGALRKAWWRIRWVRIRG